MNEVQIRIAESEDLEGIQTLFSDSILGLTRDHYTEAERRVWQSGAEDSVKWLRRIREQTFLVAITENQLCGMGSLEGDYLDVLYVHPNYAGLGIAYRIFHALEQHALENGVDRLSTDASKAAQNFFKRQGFRVVSENKNIKDGEVLVNYRMEKQLIHNEGL